MLIILQGLNTFILIIPPVFGVYFGFLGKKFLDFEITNRKVHLIIIINNSVFIILTSLVAIFIYTDEGALGSEDNTQSEYILLWSIILILIGTLIYAIKKILNVIRLDVSLLPSEDLMYPDIHGSRIIQNKLGIYSIELTKIVGIQFVFLMLYFVWEGTKEIGDF